LFLRKRRNIPFDPSTLKGGRSLYPAGAGKTYDMSKIRPTGPSLTPDPGAQRAKQLIATSTKKLFERFNKI
jgi:hypothetical protein